MSPANQHQPSIVFKDVLITFGCYLKTKHGDGWSRSKRNKNEATK